MITEATLEQSRLEWALVHVQPGILPTEEDRRLLAYLTKLHKVKPIAEMWPCFKARLLRFHELQVETDGRTNEPHDTH